MLDPVDGFTHSLNQLLLPINYRAAALAQMETLRLSASYQFKVYTAPTPQNPSPGGGADNNPVLIPAYGQIEQQLSLDPGTYIYGWLFSVLESGASASDFYVQVTDACTETPLASDYIIASLLNMTSISGGVLRGPCLLPQPRLISEPGLINVEIYNNSSSPYSGQLALFCAAPRPGPPPYSFDGNPGFHPDSGPGPQY